LAQARIFTLPDRVTISFEKGRSATAPFYRFQCP
jgi:hypothetical protein